MWNVASRLARQPAAAAKQLAVPARAMTDLPARESWLMKFQPKLNYKDLLDAPERMERNIRERGMSKLVSRDAFGVDLADLRSRHEHMKRVQSQLDTARFERNKVSALLKEAVARGAAAEAKAELLAQAKTIKDSIASLESSFQSLETALLDSALKLPNWSHPEAPVGPERNAKEVFVSEQADQSARFPHKDHLKLGLDLGLLDIERAASTSGNRFYYLRGAGALLEHALVQFAVQKSLRAGFLPHITPDMVRTETVSACGFQPRGEGSQVYSLASPYHRFSLVGTAEIPLAAYYMDELLHEQALPVKLSGAGHCFRAEAGAYGAESKGLYRVHQFTKVELFAFTEGNAEASQQVLLDIVKLQREIFDELGFRYRVLDMPTEELGASAFRKFDIEAWMPGKNAWGEVSSASDCTDYQSRRLNIRSRSGAKETVKFVHTVNGTACAVPRTIAVLLETHQQPDGSIAVPKCLQSYLGAARITREWQQELGALKPVLFDEFAKASRQGQ